MDYSYLTSFIPVEITFSAMIKFIGIIAAAIVIVSLIFRLLFGRKSALNQSICAAIGVLSIYVLTIVIYTFSPGNLEQYLVPLPFVKFSGEYLYMMSFSDTALPVICAQILSMIILVLLYNLTDSVLPDGESASALTWFVLRFLTIISSMVVHYLITGLTRGFLPDLLVSYGPTILLICLIGSLLMGALSVVLGLVLTVVNPIFGLLFTFFFSNKFGRQLSKAMLTTAVLCAVIILLNTLGYTIICISASALPSYIPLLALLLALWYVIGRKF